MKSNKTEILGFEDSWKKNRHVFGSTKSLAKVMYLDGQQSKQDEVDELKMANHNLSAMSAEAESYSEYWKYERDKLQKRIDDAWMWCEKGCMLKAMEILKGEETK